MRVEGELFCMIFGGLSVFFCIVSFFFCIVVSHFVWESFAWFIEEKRELGKVIMCLGR